MEKIDAVYTWVNKEDPAWSERFTKATGRVPGNNRYKNFGELNFSIQLMIKNCNFIRNIYIVTDRQKPSWLEENNNIIIVDHSEILGEECVKPTYKSDSIESYLHKIPDLTEIFLYLNDDCFIGNKCNINHFIDRKTKLPIARFGTANLNDRMKQQIIAGRIVSARGIILTNSMNLIKQKFGIHYNLMPIHQVQVLKKSTCELAWKLFKPELTKSVQYRIREPKINTIAFVSLVMLLGMTTGAMKAEISKFSINIYRNYALANGGPFINFSKVLKMKPQLFCFNDIDEKNAIFFKKFMLDYLI